MKRSKKKKKKGARHQEANTRVNQTQRGMFQCTNKNRDKKLHLAAEVAVCNVSEKNCYFPLFSFLFVFWVAGGPYLHLGELERVLPPGPGGPLDAVRVGGVLTAQVLAVKVGGVAVAVPPGTMVEGGAVVL